MRHRIIAVFILIFCLAGCASGSRQRPIKSLREELAVVSNKFELAKEENLNLKRELLLFKNYQDIDSHKFIEALGIFQKELAKEIADKDVWVHITERGLVIIISAEKLFLSGSDTLSEEAKGLLDEISVIIEDNFPLNYLYIEGHTDNQSLAIFEWKSDWDFSFARALSVLKYLEEKKHVDPLRLSASGFGQYRPRQSNETKEGRRLNRRIEIIISPQKLKAHQIPVRS